MCRREPIGDLHGEVEQLARASGGRNTRAVDELHYQVIWTNVVKLANIGMIQGGDGPRLPLKPCRESILCNLDCNDPIQASIPRLVHLTHTALTEGRQDIVRAEFLAGSKRHS